MTIRRVISGAVHTQLATTSSIIAKLAVCAILLAGIASAHAANGDDSSKSGVARSNLSKLEREWKRQRSHQQLTMLRRVVACRELGQCEGLQLHPTRGAALIRVSPDKPIAVAAASQAGQQPVSAARGVYAAAKGRKPIVSARVRGKQLVPAARIRSAAVRPVAADSGAMNPPGHGGDEHRGWTFGGFRSANP
jgi:hypothetical protein